MQITSEIRQNEPAFSEYVVIVDGDMGDEVHGRMLVARIKFLAQVEQP